MKKKFKVIEEGNLSLSQMGKLMGGCLYAIPCTPSQYDCRPGDGYSGCTCYQVIHSSQCVDKHGVCGIVGGCGGGTVYSTPIPCPNNCPSNNTSITMLSSVSSLTTLARL